MGEVEERPSPVSGRTKKDNTAQTGRQNVYLPTNLIARSAPFLSQDDAPWCFAPLSERASYRSRALELARTTVGDTVSVQLLWIF